MKNVFSFTTLAILLASSSIHAQTCKSNIVRTTPDSRYQVVVGSGGSEVLDTQTKLIWQRCSIGQTWSGATCTGTASTHIWTDALAKAKTLGNGYHLPNIKELQSLVEEACYGSSINEAFFPATPFNDLGDADANKLFWSSSPYVNDDKIYGDSILHGVWFVHFLDGHSFYAGNQNKGVVRAVRVAP